MFEHLATNDLIRIVEAGGGFEIVANRFSTNDLVRIAAAANGKGRLIFTDVGHLPVNDIVRISEAGQGSVHFR
jgi:hypothetical protein